MKNTNFYRKAAAWFVVLAAFVFIAAATNTQQVKAASAKIKLNKTNTSVYIGKTRRLTATVSPSTLKDKTVTWKSSNPSVATVSGGRVKGVKTGVVKITATLKSNSKVHATAQVRVKYVCVSKVTMSKSYIALRVGKSETLTEKVFPSYASNPGVTWYTKNPSLLTVENGKVTAKAVGTGYVYCISKENKRLHGRCKVRIREKIVAATGITLNQKDVKAAVNEKFTLKATVAPANTTTKTVKWYTSDAAIAKVSSKGLVTPLKAGVVTITAMTNNGKRAGCTVTVQQPAGNTTQTASITFTGANSISNMIKGSYYEIYGTLKSKYALKNVRVDIVDKKGTVYTGQDISFTKADNKTSYQIKGLDQYILFNILTKGTYYYQVKATDFNGGTRLVRRERFDVVNKWSNEIYLKQIKYSVNCTSVSTTMMIRNYFKNLGKKWSLVTVKNVEKYAWSGGLLADFTYKNSTLGNVHVKRNTDIGSSSDKVAYLKSKLSSHPEGIVIYDQDTPHAVFLTDYDSTTDTFYIADPVDATDWGGINNTGRIPMERAYILGEGQLEKVYNLDKIWEIVN